MSLRLIFGNVEGADFKCDSSFLKFHPKNSQKALLVPNLGAFVSSQNFANRQI